MGGSVGGGSPTRLPNVTGFAQNVQNMAQNYPGQNYGAGVGNQLQAIGGQQAKLASPAQGSALAQGVMSGANLGANIGTGAASSAAGFGQSLYPAAQGLMGYGNQIMQMGMDPQSALYARTLQQTQDQARAAQAARGIAMSPYGAGLEDQATRNFNIDWQNQLLNRATQAASSAQGLDQAAAGLGSSAFNLGSGASQLAASAAKEPYAARQGLFTDKANALAGVGPQIQQAAQPTQQVIGDYLQYLGLGPGYQSSAAQAQQVGQQPFSQLAGMALPLIGKGAG